MEVEVDRKDPELEGHQCNIFQVLRQFWLDGRLCDIVLKSSDGTEHPAHTNVLCAASKEFQNMLMGSFAEADQVRKGEPVEIAASEPVVRALLDYVYAGKPLLTLDHSIELLRVADAYDLPHLAAAIMAGLHVTLDNVPVVKALSILKQSQVGLHDLKNVCEEKIALNFEACLEEAAFLDLSEFQLGRILKREDLKVSREDIVLKGIFKWFNGAKGMRDGALTLLLQHVDFQAISSRNLARIGQFASTLGPKVDDLQRDVHQAMRAHQKRGLAETPDEFRPKRRCLQPCSAYLGASPNASGQKVLPNWYYSLCWHADAFYCIGDSDDCVYRWKPGEDDPQLVAGPGARVAGVNDLGLDIGVTVSSDGRIIVADCRNNRLVSFRNGFGQVLADGIEGLENVFCSPNGAVYVLNQGGTALQKLVGDTLQLVVDSENLPEDEKFGASYFFVTREEVVYISDWEHSRVLRVKQGDQNSVLVDVVGPAVEEGSGAVSSLYVTEDGMIYIAAFTQGKVLALNPGDTTWTEVLKCPDQLNPSGVVVQDGSLYVSMWKETPTGALVLGVCTNVMICLQSLVSGVTETPSPSGVLVFKRLWCFP